MNRPHELDLGGQTFPGRKGGEEKVTRSARQNFRFATKGCLSRNGVGGKKRKEKRGKKEKGVTRKEKISDLGGIGLNRSGSKCFEQSLANHNAIKKGKRNGTIDEEGGTCPSQNAAKEERKGKGVVRKIRQARQGTYLSSYYAGAKKDEEEREWKKKRKKRKGRWEGTCCQKDFSITLAPEELRRKKKKKKNKKKKGGFCGSKSKSPENSNAQRKRKKKIGFSFAGGPLHGWKGKGGGKEKKKKRGKEKRRKENLPRIRVFEKR